MPAVYAHHQFGNLVRERLSGQIRETVEQYPALFEAGLQGPDFLFFYKPLKKNPVSRRGYEIHEEKASVFLKKGLEVIQNTGAQSPEYAYLLGFICHFILDSQCHPYVAEEMRRTGVGHIEIESEFEKFLLKAAREEPVKYPMGELLLSGYKIADAVAPFYSEIGRQNVENAIDDMKRIKTFLASGSPLKRGAIRMAMRLSGHYDSLHGHLLNREDNPWCARSSQGLKKRFEGAILPAVDVILDFHETVTNGKALNARFDCNFE